MNNDEEEKLGSYSNLTDHINIDVMNTNNNNNNGKPPQPATVAANSIHWDVEEGMYCIYLHILQYIFVHILCLNSILQ